MGVRVGLGAHLSVAVSVACDGTESHWTVVSAGAALSTGAVLSMTVTVWLLALVLPQASRAVQDRNRLYLCTPLTAHPPLPGSTCGMGTQLSVALSVALAGTESHWTVVS